MDGLKCRVIQTKDKKTNAVMKMWISEDYGIPLRIEGVDETGNNAVMEYKKIKAGAQPEDTFKLPADVKVQDIGEMLKNINIPQSTK